MLLFILSISNLVMAQYPDPTDNGPCDGQHYFLCESWRDTVKQELIATGQTFGGDECHIATTWLDC